MIDLEHAERRKKHWEEEIKKGKEQQKDNSKSYPNGYAIKVREGRKGGMIAFGVIGIIFFTFLLSCLYLIDTSQLIDPLDNFGMALGITWFGMLISIVSIIAGIFSGQVKYKIIK
jgi:hypothetical protein